MASGSYHLVLRNLSAVRQPAGLPRVRSKFWLPVQFLLRVTRAAPAAAAARAAHPSDGQQGFSLPAARRCAHEHAAGFGLVGRNRSTAAPGAGTGGAAPGAAVDGPAAPVQPVVPAARLRLAMARGRAGTQRPIQ